jgi:hypothetical protein
MFRNAPDDVRELSGFSSIELGRLLHMGRNGTVNVGYLKLSRPKLLRQWKGRRDRSYIRSLNRRELASARREMRVDFGDGVYEAGRLG